MKYLTGNNTGSLRFALAGFFLCHARYGPQGVYTRGYRARKERVHESMRVSEENPLGRLLG